MQKSRFTFYIAICVFVSSLVACATKRNGLPKSIEELQAYKGDARQLQVLDPLRGGTFDLLQTTNLQPDGGIVFASAHKGKVWVRRKASPAKPRWYGAKCDGKANDLNAIQACLDRNAIVDFEQFSYLVHGSLLLHDSLELKGNGAIKQSKSQTPILLGGATRSIKITGLTFIGLRTDYIESPSSMANAIRFSNGADVLIANCNFKGFAGVAIVYSGVRAVIEHNSIIGIGKEVLKFTPVEAGSGGGIVLKFGYEPTSDIVIRENFIDSCSMGIASGDNLTRVGIYKNRITHIIGQHAVYIGEGAQDVEVIENTIEHVDLIGAKIQTYHLATRPMLRCKINKNVIRHVGGTAVTFVESTPCKFMGQDGEIKENDMQDIGQDFIEVNRAQNVIIEGNKGVSCLRNAIGLEFTKRVLIQNNTFEQIGGSGIVLSSGLNDSVQVRNNKFLEVATQKLNSNQFGVSVEVGSAVELTENEFSSKKSEMYFGIYFTPNGNPESAILDKNTVSGCFETAVQISTGKPMTFGKFQKNKISKSKREIVSGTHLYKNLDFERMTKTNVNNR
jgi:hypothetical protein